MSIRIPVLTVVFVSTIYGCASGGSTFNANRQKEWLGRSETELRHAWGTPMKVEKIKGQRVLVYPSAQSLAYQFFLSPDSRISVIRSVPDENGTYILPPTIRTLERRNPAPPPVDPSTGME